MVDNKFNADAHIPSDTEAFDKKVIEMKPKKLSPEREELNMKFSLLASRLSAYANFHLANENVFDEDKKRIGGLGPLDIQNFVQTIVTNAQLMEFCTLVQEKLTALSACFRTMEAAYLNERLGIAPLKVDTLRDFFGSAAKCLTTSDTEIFIRTVKNLEDHIKGLQTQLGVQITAEGVTVNERPAADTGLPGPAPSGTEKPN